MDTRRKAASIFTEIKNFALKGNIVDLAVAVIIGTAAINAVLL